MKTQVVIVGAGPTGLSLASQLIRYNIDFIILEKNEKTTHLSKAIVIQARTMEIFQELGISDRAIEVGQVTNAFNLFYKGKHKARIDLAGLGKGISPFPFALSLEQSKTEKLLVEHLNSHGKSIEWNSEFIRFEQNDDDVVVYFKNKSGQEQRIDCSYLVGCDGASSQVRHEMNLHFEGDTLPKLFYVADVVLSSTIINKNELFIFLIKKGFILFFPMEGTGHFRLIGILPDEEVVHDQFDFSDVEPSIKQHINSPLEFKEIRWFSTYKVHSRKAESFENRRCFIAGDAAHIHTPAGGQGMNTGIQDAYNLAWKIAFTLNGEVNSEVLKSYNFERGENAKNLLQSTDQMFDIMAGTTWFGNLIRLKVIPFFPGLITRSKIIKKRIFPLISQTGITYSNSYLTIPGSIGKVNAGVRMPYFISENRKQIYEYLTDPCFKILFFGVTIQNIDKELKDHKTKIKFFQFKEAPKKLFGTENNFYIFLRPDNHISYIGNDFDQIKSFLYKISKK
jgi:2-polyprenyl-6-methoxyphenol hydroxylase-like FAD-dependent oxidoreductase